MNELNPNENEQNDVIQNTSKHYLLGTLGAILGAFVASIPWILMYVYGNMILSALAILVAIGALKGYQIFKGTIDKKLPIIISVISLAVIIIVTLAIIPMLLLIQEGYSPTISNFKLLYAMDEFSSAIVHDLIFSIAFTVLGISGVIANINRQIKASNAPLKEIKISSTLTNPDVDSANVPEIHSVKDVFVKYNAMDKSNAMDKDIVLSELQEVENGNQLFRTLRTQQIIRKHKGKYYFSEKADQSAGYRFAILFGKIMLVVAIVAITFVVLVALDSDSTPSYNTLNEVSSQATENITKYDLPDFDMQVRVPVNMTLTTSSTDLDYLLGDGANTFYNFALYNDTDLISCFTQDTDQETVDAYYASLKETFSGSDFKIISDYKKETISGFEFTTFEAQTKGSNDKLYNDLCLGYMKDNKFVFFEYTFLTEDAAQARTVISEIIQKIK